MNLKGSAFYASVRPCSRLSWCHIYIARCRMSSFSAFLYARRLISSVGACAGFNSISFLHTGQLNSVIVMRLVDLSLILPSMHSAWYTCLQVSPTHGLDPSSWMWQRPHMSLGAALISERLRFKSGGGISIMSYGWIGSSSAPGWQTGSEQGKHSDSPSTPRQVWPHSLIFVQNAYCLRMLLRPGITWFRWLLFAFCAGTPCPATWSIGSPIIMSKSTIVICSSLLFMKL